MKQITLRWLKSKHACSDSIELFKQANTNDIRKLFEFAMEKEKFKEINWTLSRLFNKKQCVIYAVFASEMVIALYEKQYPNDNRPRKAIEAAKKYIKKQSKKNKQYSAAAAADADDAAAAAADAADDAYYYAAAAADAAYYYAAAAAADAADAAAADDDAYYYAAAADAAYYYAAAAAADAADAAAYYAAAAEKETYIKILNYGFSLIKGV